MDRLSDLIERVAQDGTLDWIGLRPSRRADMDVVAAANITAQGLVGDHGTSEKRAVTLVQAEHLPAIGSYLGRGPVAAEDLRRNLVVSGVNLASLRGRDLKIGIVVLRVTGICAPCSRMEDILGAGGYSAVRSHGGVTASVVSGGKVSVGDRVAVVTRREKTPVPIEHP